MANLKQLAAQIENAEKRIATERERVEKLRKAKKEKEEAELLKKNAPNAKWPILHKSIKSMSEFCGDLNHPVLNCVAVYQDAIIATDSYRVIIRREVHDQKKSAGFPLSESSSKLTGGTPSFPILIPAKTIKDSLNGIKNSSIPILEYAKLIQDESGVMLIGTELDKEVIHRVKKVEGEFPRKAIDGMLPSDDEKPVAEIKLSANFLASIAKEIGDETSAIKISQYVSKSGVARPLVITADNNRDKKLSEIKEIGLLMPLR